MWLEMRPRQWVKNGLCFAALIFAGRVTAWSLWPATVEVALALCLLSSGVYVLNDLFDIERDRLNPIKNHRPLAAGHLSARVASLMALGLLLSGEGVLLRIGWGEALVGALYMGNSIIYTVWLKHAVLIDVLSLGVGYCLRAYVGGLATGIQISPWLIVMLLMATVFMSVGKRRTELVAKESSPHDGSRRVLVQYSRPLLETYSTVLVAPLLALYAVWANGAASSGRLILTVPFVLYGTMRYLWLLERPGAKVNPDELLIGDVPSLVNLGLWVATCAVLLLPGAAKWLGGLRL